MIHAKDIMIGDLVNYRPGWINEETNQVEYESGTGFPVRIEMLYYCHGEGLVQYNDGENDGIEAAEYELFPIPLTPEILEKNGFKEEQLPIGIRKMIWESEDTRTEIVLYMDDTMPMEIRKNIYYEDEICYTLPFGWAVHQLQHALRLCGIEKEIEL